ncbi:hypothetical protein VIBNISOn1_1890010 [Vibrio nigripulchritudo SOn1]|uniref:Uncharacterized protein n=1 Tax=Vibrio nigripulchritudo SOn1 TaxID=1238450 RepID=A0AAV2VQD7_9VIBR|nr:hypothetical protein VIBNISOn1_1890010 [Vibrio nigripulchritudo SOn1]
MPFPCRSYFVSYIQVLIFFTLLGIPLNVLSLEESCNDRVGIFISDVSWSANCLCVTEFCVFLYRNLR